MIYELLALNFSIVTGNNYSSVNSTATNLAQTFSVPIAPYLLVMMAIGSGYYLSNKNLNLGLLLGNMMTLLLYGIGVFIHVPTLIDVRFVIGYTVLLVGYFGLSYFKPKGSEYNEIDRQANERN